MKSISTNFLVGLSTLLMTSSAIAGIVGNIPEPGMLSLFGLGGVVLAAIAIRNRRNKK